MCANPEGRRDWGRRSRRAGRGRRAIPVNQSRGKILDQIGEQGRVAAAVEEHDLGQREAPVQDHLVDVGRPVGVGRIAEVGIEGQVFALAPQPWRSVEARRRIGGLPIPEKQVVQRIGRDEVPHRAERID